MGVNCVISVPMEENKSGQYVITKLQKKIENLGAKKAGHFSVDCETYQSQIPIEGQVKVINNVHDTEYPASTFSFVENGPHLVADNTLDMLFAKMDSFYAPKKNFKIEAKGVRYELNDFLIKVGSVIIGQNTSVKGILLQIDYTPCILYNDSWGIITELLHILGINPNITNFFKSRLEKKESSVDYTDCAQQYLELFNSVRKSMTVNQQPPGMSSSPVMIQGRM
ncbi:DgyrCDS6377 [Dimorphilus gyrociliatus]|uniref:Mediator of RNA polymerase II transcription subunit 20 n=1 Tax=Dimorphilus gyrociliatus TaxID=2664684 RepID=A0A7I8VSN4_9ANNE|nr:DgyrCDS6377 [Dimorphilus gyrociliatus]